MKVLIIADEEWNDHVFGNGVLTNWFTGFNAEFAEIYCSPGLPDNQICSRYFQITDSQMLRSLISGNRAGTEPRASKQLAAGDRSVMTPQYNGWYKRLKQLSRHIHTPMMMIRDFIWISGRYNKHKLQDFISDFKPDVIFCPRLSTPKSLRLERLVRTMTSVPMVAFTGDDEASYKQYTWSPLYWIRRYYTRIMFDRTMPIYSHYFMHSSQQAQEYTEKYGVSTETLFKCSSIKEIAPVKTVNIPIRMVYAGRLYCNRWKTLSAIGDALKIINRDKVKMELDIYTSDSLTATQVKALGNDKHINMKGCVTPDRLQEIYRNADIALHVESFDRKYRYATRVSFSTKIIDLLSSTCAIMAVCWENQTGFSYLKDKDAAFCVSDIRNILPVLERICADPELINEYSHKAQRCAIDNHNRDMIHRQIRNRFQTLINDSK